MPLHIENIISYETCPKERYQDNRKNSFEKAVKYLRLGAFDLFHNIAVHVSAGLCIKYNVYLFIFYSEIYM